MILLVQYSVYLFQIVKLTRMYKFNAEQELSNIEQVDISWMNTFLYAFILVLAILSVMFAGAMHNFGNEWMNQFVSVVFSLTIFVLGFKGLFQKSIFSNVNPEMFSEPANSEFIKTKPVVVDKQRKTSLL